LLNPGGRDAGMRDVRGHESHRPVTPDSQESLFAGGVELQDAEPYWNPCVHSSIARGVSTAHR